MTERRRGLGRGLGALIPEGPAYGGNRPVDVFFPHNGSSATTAVLDPPVADGDPDAPGASPETIGRDQFGPGSSPVGPSDVDSGRSGPDQVGPDVVGPGQVGRDQVEATADGPPGTGDLVPVPGVHFAEVPVEAITPNPRQPRQTFDHDELDELVRSVREVGVLQPVVVRPDPAGGAGYELIMGERRWRAAQAAGLAVVPAIVRVTPDSHLLRDALLENLHRAELNPLEEAAAYQQLLDDFGCTHDELASRVARSRPQISNTIRLLRLPPGVQRLLGSGAISAGHARAVLAAGDTTTMLRLAERVVAEGLSVRATEDLAARGLDRATPRRRAAPAPDVRLDEIASRLSDHLAARVRISVGQRKGRIAIEFATPDDLDRILDALTPAG